MEEDLRRLLRSAVFIAIVWRTLNSPLCATNCDVSSKDSRWVSSEHVQSPAVTGDEASTVAGP